MDIVNGNLSIPRIIIAGANSGVGKTSVTLGILYGLTKLNYKIQSFKIGPDFIDPSYHRFVTDTPSYNLDSWLMGETGVRNTFEKYTIEKDIAVIEGVMGLFDGADGKSNFASTAHIAKILDCPIILVIDASKAARSIAAVAYGFFNFDKKIQIKGIILNKLSSNRHFLLIKDAFDSKLRIPIVGAIFRNQEYTFLERHLGLIPVTELENKRKKQILNSAGSFSDSLDYEKIINIIGPYKNKKIAKRKSISKRNNIIKIAIALDDSFNFYYQENLDILREKGAQLNFFSPLHDISLPEEIDGIIIGGGFPEILARDLNQNQSMMKAIKKIGEDNKPIYAECGGLMYLTKSIKETNFKYREKKIPKMLQNYEKTYKMIGLIDAMTNMTDQLTLNYTQGNMIKESIFGVNNTFKGHEFHFSKLENVSKDIKYSYCLKKGQGIMNKRDGIILHNILASYSHLHFSNVKLASNFISKCTKVSRK